MLLLQNYLDQFICTLEHVSLYKNNDSFGTQLWGLRVIIHFEGGVDGDFGSFQAV